MTEQIHDMYYFTTERDDGRWGLGFYKDRERGWWMGVGVLQGQREMMVDGVGVSQGQRERMGDYYYVRD